MLSFLRIRHFAIIADLELELQPGFTVITGETGAGKSILVDALGFIFGRRADSNLVHSSANRAELSAAFDISAAPAAGHWLAEQQLDDGGDCLVRRTLSAAGGSRAWINGSPVTARQLQELASLMIDIHGQHDQQRLLQPAARLALVDQAGVDAGCLRAVSDLATRHRRLQQELAQLQSRYRSGSDREAGALLRYQLDELDAAAESIARLDELDAEQHRLAHAEQIQQSLAAALERLQADQHGVLDNLRQSIGEIDTAAEFTDAAGECRHMLEEAAINISESAASLQRQLERVDLDPERLRQVESELSRIHELARKHRVEPALLAEHHEQLRQQYQAASDAGRRIGELEAKLAETGSNYDQAARKLHRRRCEVAERLGSKVEQYLRRLAMENARLVIEVRHDPERPPATGGRDQVDILFTANPDQKPRSLARVASGGELSRIGLALMMAARPRDSLPALIFDEVDAGIGGATASTVGAMLARIASGRQAFCVTHMAQVAACADHHILVNKQVSGGQTRTGHEYLQGKTRLEELARMLSGRISASSLQHARELLEAAAA